MYWDNYQIFATGQFDHIPYRNVQSRTYYVDIYQKNGINSRPLRMTFGKDPVVQNWINDNQSVPIKGSELRLNVLNINNSLPITTFYSEEDDTFKVVFYTYLSDGITQQVLFTGYLVQEDSSEIKSDITHEINLTFTDNLGILKDIDFGLANRMSASSSSKIRTLNANIWTATDTNGIKYLIVDSLDGTPSVNDSIYIYNTPFFNGTYTITSVKPYAQSGFIIYIREPIEYNISPVNAEIRYIEYTKLDDVIRLKDFFRICLQNTSLQLNMIYGGSISVVDGASVKSDILDNVFMHPDTFINDDLVSYDSCYDVLEAICSRFKLTLFQALGKWYAIRNFELRNYQNDLNGYEYDFYFNQLSQLTTGITKQLDYGDLSDIEFGLLDILNRPLKSYKEKFPFDYSENVIRNGKFTLLGDYVLKLKSYTSDQVKYYKWPGWDEKPNALNRWNPTTPLYTGRDAFIGVRYDENGAEVERYGVVSSVKPNTWTILSDGSSYNISAMQINGYGLPMSPPISVNKGDRIRVSFSFKSTKDVPRIIQIIIFVSPNLCKVTNQPGGQSLQATYLLANGEWGSLANTNRQIDNPLEWNDVDIMSQGIPFDGQVSICLPTLADVGPNPYPIADQTWTAAATLIRDLEFEYFPAVIGQTNLKGQVNNSYSGNIVRKSEEVELKIDACEKNLVSGCLYLSDKANCINKLAINWQDGLINKNFRLGEIITRQAMALYKKPRHKIEGKLLEVLDSNDNFLCPNKILRILLFGNTYFSFGKLEVNYKEDMANVTLFEEWQFPERPYNPDSFEPEGILFDKNIIYNFNYY